jgi:hypothetical protein
MVKVIRTCVTLLAVGVSAIAASQQEIEQDIDQMLAHSHGMLELEHTVAPVVKRGPDAVKPLIARYLSGKPQDQLILALCLCKLPTEESLAFLCDILQKHDSVRDKNVGLLYLVIRSFPEEYEDRITDLLIDIVASRRQGSWDAAERLGGMLKRKPAIAGELVRALPDDDSSNGCNWGIYEVLEPVSGYSLGTFSNQFWRAWWSRNEKKDFIDWRIEAFLSDPRNAQRKYNALANLGAQHDWRAVPVLLQGLEDNSAEVRYSSVCCLWEFLGQVHEPYSFDKFRQEEADVIVKLKRDVVVEQGRTAQPTKPSEASPQ